MQTKFFIAALFTMASFIAYGQDNFVIYHTTGSAYIIMGQQQIPAERGKKINKFCSLQLKINSSCMLIDTVGRSVLVNKPGTYSFKALVQLMNNAGKENIPKAFFAYIYQNFTKEKKTNAQHITAIVQRGHPFMKLPKDSFIVSSSRITFTWKSVSPRLMMQIIIRDHSENILLDTTIKRTTSLTLNTNRSFFKSGSRYSWKVDEAGTTQPEEKYFSFIIPAKEKIREINTQKQAIAAKNISAEAKRQMEKDLYQYWCEFYQIK